MDDDTDRPAMVELNKAAAWFQQAYVAIRCAGGEPSAVIGRIPEETLRTLIQNNLLLFYKA